MLSLRPSEIVSALTHLDVKPPCHTPVKTHNTHHRCVSANLPKMPPTPRTPRSSPLQASPLEGLLLSMRPSEIVSASPPSPVTAALLRTFLAACPNCRLEGGLRPGWEGESAGQDDGGDGGSSAADREVDEQLQDIYAAGEWVGSQPGLRAARSQADKMCELTSDAETGSHGVSGSPHITCCGMVERRCLLDCLQALKAGGVRRRGGGSKRLSGVSVLVEHILFHPDC